MNYIIGDISKYRGMVLLKVSNGWRIYKKQIDTNNYIANVKGSKITAIDWIDDYLDQIILRGI